MQLTVRKPLWNNSTEIPIIHELLQNKYNWKGTE